MIKKSLHKKAAVFFGILLVPIIAYCQISDTTIILGRVNERSFIWSKPSTSESRKLQQAGQDEFIYLINIASDASDLWYHCVYKNTEGFIPTSKIDIYGNYSTEKMNYLLKNKDKTFPSRLEISRALGASEGHVQDSIAKKKKDDNDAYYQKLVDSKAKLVTALVLRAKQDKILLIKYSFPISIIGYPGFKVRLVNGYKKPIKYLFFKITGYNSVNDVEATKEVRCIGEIAAFDNKEYEFENVFLSKVIDHCGIPLIRVQFMDNTTTTLSGTQLEINYLKSDMGKMSDIDGFDDILKQVYYAHFNEKD